MYSTCFAIKGMQPNNIRWLYDSIGTSTTWVPPHPMWVACHACHMVDWDSTSLIATFSDIWIFILPRMEAFALATGLATWLAFALGKTAVLSRLIYSRLAVSKLVSHPTENIRDAPAEVKMVGTSNFARNFLPENQELRKTTVHVDLFLVSLFQLKSHAPK